MEPKIVCCHVKVRNNKALTNFYRVAAEILLYDMAKKKRAARVNVEVKVNEWLVGKKLVLVKTNLAYRNGLSFKKLPESPLCNKEWCICVEYEGGFNYHLLLKRLLKQYKLAFTNIMTDEHWKP